MASKLLMQGPVNPSTDDGAASVTAHCFVRLSSHQETVIGEDGYREGQLPNQWLSDSITVQDGYREVTVLVCQGHGDCRVISLSA